MKLRAGQIFAVLAMAIAAALPAVAETDGFVIAVDPVYDGIALSGLALGALGSEFIPNLIGDRGYVAPSLASIPAWERLSMAPYSKALDSAGDYFVAASLLLPVLPALVGSKEVALARPIGKIDRLPDWLEIGAMYGESLAAAYMLKNVLKSFIPRARPYLYDPDAPASLALDPDSIRSFPSGHATLAFTAASFASTMFILRDPGSPWVIPWTCFCLGSATAIAVTRVESGAHFWGDVLVGAGIGIVAGTATPLLHLRAKKEKPMADDALSCSLLPGGIVIAYRY